MTYKSALQYIHAKQRFGIKPGLERVSALLARLDDPQDALPVIHVAGTNGKGSTCALLAGGLAAAGYTVGLYTSPYVVNFRERIQINGEMITEEELAVLAETVFPIDRELADEGVVLTEFELITAMAFLWFARHEVDFVVLETGLGGRFDATNVIKKPFVSVITKIAMDHADILGNTLTLIAAEKCGIIKNGCPVVTTEKQETEVLDVIHVACISKNARLVLPDTPYVSNVFYSLDGVSFDFFGRRVRIPFCGKQQLDNGLLALTVAFTLRNVHNINFDNDAFLAGLSEAKLPARQEVLAKNPTLILDGAHNPDGIAALCDTVRNYIGHDGSLLILGMLADKDVDKCAEIISPLFERIITVTVQNDRAINADDLRGIVRKYNENVTAADIPAAMEAVRDNRADGGACVVTGSLYLAGSVRGQLIMNNEQ